MHNDNIACKIPITIQSNQRIINNNTNNNANNINDNYADNDTNNNYQQ